MAKESIPRSVADRFLGKLRLAASTRSGSRMATVTHLLPVQHPDRAAPSIYTVYLTLIDDGRFLATCRECPELETYGDDEAAALIMAEAAIHLIEAQRRSSPEDIG